MGKKSRAQRIKIYAEEAARRRCPNCGHRGAHYMPPSLGEPGFFVCQPQGDPA